MEAEGFPRAAEVEVLLVAGASLVDGIDATAEHFIVLGDVVVGRIPEVGAVGCGVGAEEFSEEK